MHNKIASGLKSFYYLCEKLPLSLKLVTSEGAVSNNVLYYQQHSVACYQVTFILTTILKLPIVSSAFKSINILFARE